MNIKQDRFVRVLLRCAEVAQQGGIDPSISNVHNEALAGPANAYLAVNTAFSDALIACAEKKSEASKALVSLNGPYKVARSTLKAIVPATSKAVPDTLKALPTDTDQVWAIQWILGEIQKRAGKEWADALISGEFGVKATTALAALNEAIASGNELTKVRMARAAAYEPAYERYLDFKQVVRDALGPASREYRRIHLRASPKSAGEEPNGAPTANKGSAAPAEPTPGAALSAAPAEPTPGATPSAAPAEAANP